MNVVRNIVIFTKNWRKKYTIFKLLFSEKPIVEKPPVVHTRDQVGERDVTEDETSLYYIIRNSKSAIAVSFVLMHIS